jgi:hypothetical protein
MLFKKKTPIITLGLGQKPVPERDAEALQPEARSGQVTPDEATHQSPEETAVSSEIVVAQPAAEKVPASTKPKPVRPETVSASPASGKEVPQTVPDDAPAAVSPSSSPGQAAAGDDNIQGLVQAGAVTEHTQCGYCLELTPRDQERCEHCGNAIRDAAEAGTSSPKPGKGTARPAKAPAAEKPAPKPSPASAQETLVPESDTRKLTHKPTPTVLKETTLFTPAQLTLLDDPLKTNGQVYSLKIGQTRIGRGQDNDLPFPEEEFISRHHCEIGYHKYQYVLKDLQSANGSYVNDVKVRETILRDGDTIQIGSMRFLFEDPVEKMKKRKAGAGQEANLEE